MLWIKLLSTVLAGFGMHQFYRPSQTFGPRWGSLIRYAVGTIGMLPFLILINRQISNPHHTPSPEGQDERLTVSYLVTAVAFGTGTFLGHMVDRARSDEPV